MKTAKEIAEKIYPGDWPIALHLRVGLQNQIEAYARECVKVNLIRAADNAEIDFKGQETQHPIEVISESITDIEIKLL